MMLRDEVERTIDDWNCHEIERRGTGIITYDCSPDGYQAFPRDRLTTLERLEILAIAAEQQGSSELTTVIQSNITYLRAILGERLSLSEYVKATQGSEIGRWKPDYLDERRTIALERLNTIGIAWNKGTRTEVENFEGALSIADVPDALRQEADRLLPEARKATGTTAGYELSIELVDIDAYWAYWVDCARDQARLRLNCKNSSFTPTRIRQFAVHEILGHALQCASFYATCTKGSTSWLRKFSVFGNHQILFEGLAQALPLFIAPDDYRLLAHVHLDHYLQLVRAELHVAINDGTGVQECAALARRLVPFWTNGNIGDILADRSVDPLLRSYLWSYPAGADWFVALAEDAPNSTQQTVLRACYEAPRTPTQLHALWPERQSSRSPQPG
ncbi:MAG: hypothetical protein ACRDRW_14350 [Pseudonocardiaceae bacterium]